jgi:hypothetical protein
MKYSHLVNPKCPICKGTGLVKAKPKKTWMGTVQVGNDYCLCVKEKLPKTTKP